jgi:hypothetical protein
MAQLGDLPSAKVGLSVFVSVAMSLTTTLHQVLSKYWQQNREGMLHEKFNILIQ